MNQTKQKSFWKLHTEDLFYVLVSAQQQGVCFVAESLRGRWIHQMCCNEEQFYKLSTSRHDGVNDLKFQSCVLHLEHFTCFRLSHVCLYVCIYVRFIGEESVAAGEACDLTDSPTWIIDPIDGTTNFVHA